MNFVKLFRTKTAPAQCSEYFGKFPGKLSRWSHLLSEKFFGGSRPNILKGIFGEIDVSEEIAIENYPEDVKDSAYNMTTLT